MSDKSLFADWLEKKYLNWQMENGRTSIRRFAKWLESNRVGRGVGKSNHNHHQKNRIILI